MILFADLDGTLIDTISEDTFPRGVWDMFLKFDVLNAIKNLHPEYVLIASNQGGIEKGFVDMTDFIKKIRYIQVAISEYCECLVDYQFCIANDKKDYRRKPNTGMLEGLLKSIEALGAEIPDKSEMLMVGDASGKEGQFSDSDKRTAENFGIAYMDVEDFVEKYR